RLLPTIAGRPNYRLRTGTKVVRLLTDGDGSRVTAVEYLDVARGERHRLRARYVVLAAGAIETPRILFNSADDRHPGGLANHGDLVGPRLQGNPKVALSTSLY